MSFCCCCCCPALLCSFCSRDNWKRICWWALVAVLNNKCSLFLLHMCIFARTNVRSLQKKNWINKISDSDIILRMTIRNWTTNIPEKNGNFCSLTIKSYTIIKHFLFVWIFHSRCAHQNYNPHNMRTVCRGYMHRPCFSQYFMYADEWKSNTKKWWKMDERRPKQTE